MEKMPEQEETKNVLKEKEEWVTIQTKQQKKAKNT